MAIDYQAQLNKMKEAQKQSAIADLENTRNQALSDLEQERTTNAANFNTQRSQANVKNQLAAKNFKEYLVNSGRSNSGIMPQYEMNRQNNLQRSLNDINSNQNMALADINRRGTLANNAYNTGLQSANATIEANYINNLLQQQQAAWEREMQEKEFNEKVRQYNENMAFQREQYANQLSRQSVGRSSGGSGRSGGRRSSGGKNNNSGGGSSLGSTAQSLLKDTQQFIAAANKQGAGAAATVLPKVISQLNTAYNAGRITANELKTITNTLGI